MSQFYSCMPCQCNDSFTEKASESKMTPRMALEQFNKIKAPKRNISTTASH